jgi:hypothetical protein
MLEMVCVALSLLVSTAVSASSYFFARREGWRSVVKEQLQLPVEGPLDRGGSAGVAADESLREVGSHLGGLGSPPPFRFRLQEADGLPARVEGAVGTAGTEVLETLGDPLLDLLGHERLGRHDHLAPFQLDLEVVARRESPSSSWILFGMTT